MKICILAPRYPFPEAAGDVLRINNLTRYFVRKGHKVILVSFFDKSSDLEDENKKIYNKIYLIKRNRILSLASVLVSLLTCKPLQNAFFYSKKYEKAFKKIAIDEEPDIFLIHTGRMVQYVDKLDVKNKCIVDLADALSKTYSLVNISSVNSYKKYAYLIERNRIKKFENYVVNNYKKVVLVSEEDKRYMGNGKSIYVYPMGININKDFRDNYDNNKIVFVGNMRTLQNQDAALFFVREVFPSLKIEYPNLKFYIIGAEPSKKIIEELSGDNIVITGYVDSIDKEIADACLAVAPVRIAAGIQNKVLIAMANHLPVVLSKTISVGIPEIDDGENCYIADTADEYINLCKKLIGDKSERNRIADKGYEMVRVNYAWDSVLSGYENIES